MNKNIKLAVAGAVLALSASANAGIIIPAGEWTIDLNGNVNTFASWTKGKGTDTTAAAVGGLATASQTHEDQTQSIGTGLLPAWLGFTGKTRQNDLDVEFTVSIQPNSSNNTPHGDGAVGGTTSSLLNRQTYVSFGDKSWGTIKLGKDLGVFAADAILNDMTLLGVGAGAANSGAAANTTLGGIGTGYIYAAWKGQVAYTTPNFNGFQATVAITNPNQNADAVVQATYQDRFGLEGKASYSFAGDVASGKLWVSGASYDVTRNQTGASYTATVADLGLNVNAGNLGLTGYYYTGEGVGTTVLGNLAFDATSGAKRDSDGGYAQVTYVLPTKTKLGLAYGTSNLDRAAAADLAVINKNERITVGLYHPLTKHLNLVAEYNDIESRVHNGNKGESQTGSLGAILFF
jgi:predicted porin